MATRRQARKPETPESEGQEGQASPETPATGQTNPEGQAGSEAPATEQTSTEGQANPDSGQATPEGQANPDSGQASTEGQASPDSGQATPETPATGQTSTETPAQTEMEGGEFDPRKAEMMERLFQLFHEREARNKHFEFHSQTSFIVDLTDDELEAFHQEVKATLNERGIKKVVERDFDALQSMLSEVLTNNEASE